MEFEHKHEKLLPRALFIKRVLKYSAFCTGFIIVSLGIGIAGYMYYCHLDFVSGLLNASMILTGMGPVDPMPNNPLKSLPRFTPFSAEWLSLLPLPYFLLHLPTA